MKKIIVIIALVLGLPGSASPNEFLRMICGEDIYRTNYVQLWKNGKLVSKPPDKHYASKGYVVRKHSWRPIFHVKSTIGSLTLRNIYVDFYALTVSDTPTSARIGTHTTCYR